MKKVLMSLIVCCLMAVSIAAQETVTVTSIKANLRGTPTNTGIMVTTVSNGETFELIKEKAPWYLVQTPKYVGWIHGNSITLGAEAGDDIDAFMQKRLQERRPQTTSKPISTGSSPFQSEYVGGETTSISVMNETDRTLALIFGGVKYTVGGGGQREIEVEGGRYEYSASVPRAYPTGGVKEFGKGYRFSWRFFIVRR